MSARAFCHHCGADVTRDAPILIDEFSMNGDGWPLCWRGKPLKLTAAEASVCWTLMKAYPDHVASHIIHERVGGEESDNNTNTIQVLVCRIRAKLEAIGAPQSIATVRGRGYRWQTGETTYETIAAPFPYTTASLLSQAFTRDGEQ